MGLGELLDRKLDLPGSGPGVVEVEGAKGIAQVEIVDLDRLGAQIERVGVRVPESAPLTQQAADICERVRELGDRLVPVEVDPRLGGGVLRSDPEELRGGYYEVGLDGSGATVERYAVDEEGTRSREAFTLTRNQLERLVDDLERGLSG